jgi:hypothetical protein
MSTINNGLRQNDIEDTDLSGLDLSLYENIFNVNIVDNIEKQHYFYNTLNSVSLPVNLDNSVFDEIEPNYDIPWTTLSYNIYGTMSLWWLIFLVNKPEYIFLAKSGIPLKFIKQEYVVEILSQMNNL